MRIAFLVTRADTIGGSHIHVRDMTIALRKEGHKADIVMGGDGPIVDHFKSVGINPIIISSLKRNISPFADVKAYLQIKKELKKLNPDLVSTHSSKAGFLGRLAAKSVGLPVIFTAHGWSFTTGKSRLSRFLYLLLEKIVAPISNKIITVSDYDRKLAIDHLRMNPENVITIHNGMPDVELVKKDQKNSEKVNIVMVARFDNQKNHIELLNTIYPLNGYHIHFVGDGPLLSQVKKHAENLNIHSNITFWGRLDSVEHVLNQSDIFALISNWEGFPRSTLEAMRTGLPVIVSNVGGAAEAIENGISGFVVNKGDVNTLRHVLAELLNNEKMRKKMGIKAKERFETFYKFEIMYRKTVKIYEEVLNAARK